jgi:hypothetical protein
MSADVAGSAPLVCHASGFNGVRALLSRVPVEERNPVGDSVAPTERWVSFERVVDAVLGTGPLFGDTHARLAFIGALAAGSTAIVPCDENMIARDRDVTRLAMVGYTAGDIGRMLTGRVTRSQVDVAYARKMAGLGSLPEPAAPASRLPASPIGATLTVSLESRPAPLVVTVPAFPAPIRPGPALATTTFRRPGPELVTPETLDACVRLYANAYQVDYRLVHAMIRNESNWHPSVVSNKGAVGLMQLMPGTASMLNVDPRNPIENIKGGVAYLAGLLRTYGTVRNALIAYNAGPVHANQVIRGERGLFNETQRYLDAIATTYPIDRMP